MTKQDRFGRSLSLSVTIDEDDVLCVHSAGCGCCEEGYDNAGFFMLGEVRVNTGTPAKDLRLVSSKLVEMAERLEQSLL